MRLLYDISLRLYNFIIWCASFFNPKAKKWIQGRRNSFSQLKQFAAENPKNIWVHCASVGEFEQGIPLIQKLQKEYSQYKILISFFSPSGYDYSKNKYPNLHILYLPLDTRRNAEKWYSILKPRAAFFIKYEFWHHFITKAKQSNIPLLVVSAVFWKDLFFFKKYGAFFRKSLKKVTHFFVQDQTSSSLLKEIGIEKVSVIGDTRYERVLELKQKVYTNEKVEQFISNKKVFIAGSVWNSDIPTLHQLISELPVDFKIIIAPHEVNHFDYTKFSNYSTTLYTSEVNNTAKILFVDTIGILSQIYQFATIAYVGGGFGKGIHNVLEPAVHNIPVLIGPNHKQFIEAVELKKNGMLFIIPDSGKFTDALNSSLSLKKEIKEQNKAFFAQKAKLSQQNIVFIKKHSILD